VKDSVTGREWYGWRDAQPATASQAALAENLERQRQETAAAAQPQVATASQAVAETAVAEIKPDRRDWRARRREQAEARRELFEQQVKSGDLIVRRASPDELSQLRADREQFLESHPEAVEKANELRAQMPPAARPAKPMRTVVCPNCGVTFETRHDRVYCTRSCASIGSRKTAALPPRPCEWCRESFTPPHHSSRFCSDACRSRERRARALTDQMS
jgi:pyruvate/2-oxoglutarate dehydrogenase complex dihydrolipoamide acyltransferase (E2) component